MVPSQVHFRTIYRILNDVKESLSHNSADITLFTPNLLFCVSATQAQQSFDTSTIEVSLMGMCLVCQSIVGFLLMPLLMDDGATFGLLNCIGFRLLMV